MNKKVFITTLSVTILLLLIAQLLSYEIASAGFLIAALMIIETKNALNSSKKIFSFNPIKNYYKSKNKLEKYRKFAIVNFIIFFLIGVFGVVFGVLGIVD